MADFKDIVSTMQKLNDFAKKELSKDEQSVLNSIFDVYNYAMKNRDSVFKETPDFIKEIDEFEEVQIRSQLVITPLLTLTTLTTILASHPIITCSKLTQVANRLK